MKCALTASISSYLDLHVEVSLLALFPLLRLYPFLLLQTFHQLLGDVHVGHGLEHLAWNRRKAPNYLEIKTAIRENLMQRRCPLTQLGLPDVDQHVCVGAVAHRQVIVVSAIVVLYGFLLSAP